MPEGLGRHAEDPLRHLPRSGPRDLAPDERRQELGVEPGGAVTQAVVGDGRMILAQTLVAEVVSQSFVQALIGRRNVAGDCQVGVQRHQGGVRYRLSQRMTPV